MPELYASRLTKFPVVSDMADTAASMEQSFNQLSTAPEHIKKIGGIGTTYCGAAGLRTRRTDHQFIIARYLQGVASVSMV